MKTVFTIEDLEYIIAVNIEIQGYAYIPELTEDDYGTLENVIDNFCEIYKCSYTYDFRKHCFKISKIDSK